MVIASLLATLSLILPGGRIQGFLIGLQAINSPRFTFATERVAQFSIA